MIDSAEVARAAKKGLVRAQSTYECWSGWWAPPPEYLATVSIARTVHRLESVRWVTLEHKSSAGMKLRIVLDPKRAGSARTESARALALRSHTCTGRAE